MSSQTAVRPSTPTSTSRIAVPTGPALIVAMLVFLAHLPLAIVHFQQLWFKPHYQLFPIVLCGSYVLLWPLSSFSWTVPGPLGLANKLMALGLVCLAIGMTGESIEGWNLGTPGTWVAVAGVAMLAALPLELLGSPTQVFAGQANPKAGMIMVGVCWIVLLFAAFFRAPAIATFSAIGVISAVPMTAGGWTLLRRCLPGLAYLLLILPPPFGLDNVLVQNLQFFAARVSSLVLDFIGIRHFLNGVTIEIGDKTYMVEQGCSGISSLLSTLACVLFYVLWHRVGVIRGTLLTISSIFWVLVNNCCRIIGITFFGVGFNIPFWGKHVSMNLTDGIPHQIFGLVLFVLTLFMLWSTDRLLMFIGRSDAPRRRFDPVPGAQDGVDIGWRLTLTHPATWLRSYGVAGAFGVLVALQMLDLYALVVRLPYSGTALAKLYEGVDVNTMPEKFGPWVRNKDIRTPARPAGDPLGQYSRIWDYRVNVTQAAVSLDYPYPEFHDLRVCYSVLGWKFDTTTSFEHKTDDQVQHCVAVTMHKQNENFGALWYCSFDQDGVAVDPSLETDLRIVSEKGIADRAAARINARLSQWRQAFSSESAKNSGVGSILQVQMLITTHEPLPPNALEESQKLFIEGVTRIRKKCIELKAKR